MRITVIVTSFSEIRVYAGFVIAEGGLIWLCLSCAICCTGVTDLSIAVRIRYFYLV